MRLQAIEGDRRVHVIEDFHNPFSKFGKEFASRQGVRAVGRNQSDVGVCETVTGHSGSEIPAVIQNEFSVRPGSEIACFGVIGKLSFEKG
jgi:hypothetical protein